MFRTVTKAGILVSRVNKQRGGFFQQNNKTTTTTSIINRTIITLLDQQPFQHESLACFRTILGRRIHVCEDCRSVKTRNISRIGFFGTLKKDYHEFNLCKHCKNKINRFDDNNFVKIIFKKHFDA